MKFEGQLLAIHAEIAKLNKKIIDLQVKIDSNQRFTSIVLLIIILLLIGRWIFI